MSRQLSLYQKQNSYQCYHCYQPEFRRTSSTTTAADNPDIITEDCEEVGSLPTAGTGTVTAPDDLASTPDCPKSQPLHITYPKRSFSGKLRSFTPSWYTKFPWIEYSVKKDAVFCFQCRLFGPSSNVTSRPEKAFTSTGFRDWRHATGERGILNCHEKCLAHSQSTLAWDMYRSTSKTGTVAEQLGNNRSELEQTLYQNHSGNSFTMQ